MRVYINMKRNYLSWMTTVLMAFACVAFISCDKDDDNDDGGNGSGNLTAAEASFSVNYGFYDLYDEYDGEKYWELAFYNFDPNSKTMPQSINEVIIYFTVPESIEGIPVGTFNDFGVSICKGENPKVEEPTGDYYFGEADRIRNRADLKISKSGDKYTVSFENLSINKEGSELATSASFSYTGKLMQAPDYEQ